MDHFSPPSPAPAIAALLAALSLSACAPSGESFDGGTEPSDAGEPDAGGVNRDVAPGVWSLDALDIATPPHDLAPLEDIIGGAPVVALGETVHFSNGYHQARVRVIKHLIEDLGFRAVAYEGMWGDSLATKAFVEEGTGNLSEAMVGLTFAAWWSESNAWLLEWLRAWNESHPDDPVRIFGVDVQDPRQDGAWLSEFLTTADATGSASIVEELSGCVGVGLDDGDYLALIQGLCDGSSSLPPADDERCLAGIGAATTWVDDNEATLTESQGHERVALARVAARALSAGHAELRDCADFVLSSNHRDHGMADTFEALRTLWAPEADTVIFAHNLHIATNGEDLDSGGYQWKGMGSWLGERMGDDYVPIGLFASEVRSNWFGANEVYELSYESADAIETALYGLGELLLVDLEQATQPGGPFTAETSYGMSDQRGVPREHYRALMYMQESAEMDYWNDIGP